MILPQHSNSRLGAVVAQPEPVKFDLLLSEFCDDTHFFTEGRPGFHSLRRQNNFLFFFPIPPSSRKPVSSTGYLFEQGRRVLEVVITISLLVPGN